MVTYNGLIAKLFKRGPSAPRAHKVLWVWLTQTKKYMKKITCIGCEITRGKFWHQFLAGQPALPNSKNLKKLLAPALTGALT